MVFKVGRAMLLTAWLWLAGSGTRPFRGYTLDATIAKTRRLDSDPDAPELMVDHLKEWKKLARQTEATLWFPVEHFGREFTKAQRGGYAAVFVVVMSVSVSVPLLMSICLCGGCMLSRRAGCSATCKRSPEAVPYIERGETDEGLLSSAVYLKRSKDFKRPLTAMYIGGALVWILIAVLLAIPTGVLVFLTNALFPDVWWLGLLFLPFFYSMFLYDGFSRWWKYFKDLPECLSETIFGSAVPINALDPTPVSMRPIHMTLGELWWAHHHFYLPFAMRFVSRIFIRLPYLKLRWQFSAVAPKLQPDELLAWWALETTVFYWFIRAEERDGVLLGYFSSEKFGPIRTILNIGCSHRQMPDEAGAATQKPVYDIDKIEIWVDLRSRKAVRAQLDGVEVKFSRVAALVGFIFSLQSHAWLHAISVWGVMPDNKLHSFVRKMSVATMYNNHLGFDGGLEVIATLTGRKEMVTTGSLRSSQFADRLPYNDEQIMLGPHFAATFDFFSTTCVGALVPYSRFLAFAYLLFPHFMKALQAESPGSITNCPTAYFDQTVIHCTDHWMFAEEFSTSLSGFASLASAVKDACSGPIAPGEPDIDYGSIGEALMLTLGLSVDFPKLFPCYFRDAPKDISFYHKVYKAALKLDPELAYHMQAAFVK